MSFQLYCDGCGKWLSFRDSEDEPKCRECNTSRWLMDNEPNRSQWGAYIDWQHDCRSDADPGL